MAVAVASNDLVRWDALWVILKDWSQDDLVERLSSDALEDAVLDARPRADRDSILRDPENATTRRSHGVDDDLNSIRLCGGAITAEGERVAYEKAIRGE